MAVVSIELRNEEYERVREVLSDVLVETRDGHYRSIDLSGMADNYIEFLVRQAIATGQINDEISYFVSPDDLQRTSELSDTYTLIALSNYPVLDIETAVESDKLPNDETINTLSEALSGYDWSMDTIDSFKEYASPEAIEAINQQGNPRFIAFDIQDDTAFITADNPEEFIRMVESTIAFTDENREWERYIGEPAAQGLSELNWVDMQDDDPLFNLPKVYSRALGDIEAQIAYEYRLEGESKEVMLKSVPQLYDLDGQYSTIPYLKAMDHAQVYMSQLGEDVDQSPTI